MAWDYLDEDDELEDHEYPDEPEDDDSLEDDDVYIGCPECGADVYEDALQCPECGFYMDESSRAALPTHWKLVAVLILIVFGISVLAALF